MAFLQGGLAAAERSVVEGHLASCSACAELMTWAAADQANSESLGRARRPSVRRAAGARVARRPLSDPGRGRARRHGRGLRRVPPGPGPPHRAEGRARIGRRVAPSAARACCARRARSRGCRTRTSSPSTTPAPSTIASTSRWSSSRARRSTPGCAPSRAAGARSWTCSSPRAAAWRRRTPPASSTATSSPRTS